MIEFIELLFCCADAHLEPESRAILLMIGMALSLVAALYAFFGLRSLTGTGIALAAFLAMLLVLIVTARRHPEI